MDLADVGEFGLIDRLRRILGDAPEGERWIGDDAAILRAPAGTILLTADLLVEGIHFDLGWTSPEDLGWKAMAANCSDIAAMGGTPCRAVVSLGIRPGLDVEFFESLYRGMRSCCDAFGLAVVGGDLSRCSQLVISVALLGNPAGRRVVERSGAEVGDRICVTGTLGAAAAGLSALRAGRAVAPELAAAHLRPVPRVREAEALRRFLPSAMIDVSDGFAADLRHLCEASGVGATIEAAALPVVEVDGGLGLALGGGEDYELCFTIPEERAARAAADVGAATGTPIAIVGEIVPAGEGRTLVLADGTRATLDAPGWDHFVRGA